jgi:hypothetical protein
LIGAARIYEAVDFADPNVSSWRRTLTATLDATAFPAIAAVREMKTTGGGRIVLISSSDTIKSEPEVAPTTPPRPRSGPSFGRSSWIARGTEFKPMLLRQAGCTRPWSRATSISLRHDLRRWWSNDTSGDAVTGGGRTT